MEYWYPEWKITGVLGDDVFPQDNLISFWQEERDMADHLDLVEGGFSTLIGLVLS